MCHARLPLFFAIALTLQLAVSPSVEASPPAASEVERWSRLLAESPRGVGPVIENRQAWELWTNGKAARDVVQQAEQLIDEPIPVLSDEMYLDFSRTGNRQLYQRPLSQCRNRLNTLVLAECIENRGRFLPAIAESIERTCAEKTWVIPAHDYKLENFRGEAIEIDLGAANTAWSLATARYWLGDRFPPETRELIANELERRIFKPFVGMVTEGKPREWWLTWTNNWNAVCLSGVVGSALATIESRPRRAFFVAAAEKYVQNFLDGFTSDGYCSEGVGYWGYGFGHYVMLAEVLRLASNGKVDWMDDAKIRRISMFGRNMEILPTVYPAFADCLVGNSPSVPLMALLNRRYDWGLKDLAERGREYALQKCGSLVDLALFSWPVLQAAATTDAKTAATSAGTEAETKPLRTWYPDAGVLICRPATGSQRAMGAALKGGHNDEHHNHNDVGTFVVALNGSTPLLDPGAEVYTARTFSKRRYQSNAINSFGHPVPRVAGQLQATGRQAAARVLNTEFTDKIDSLTLDLTAAYKVKELKKLVRTFTFSREGKGKLTVVDNVEFDSPQTFETALITIDDWQQLSPNRLLVGKAPSEVIVDIVVRGANFRVSAEAIDEDMRNGIKPTRLGIALTEPVERATITLTIEPAAQN